MITLKEYKSLHFQYRNLLYCPSNAWYKRCQLTKNDKKKRWKSTQTEEKALEIAFAIDPISSDPKQIPKNKATNIFTSSTEFSQRAFEPSTLGNCSIRQHRQKSSSIVLSIAEKPFDTGGSSVIRIVRQKCAKCQPTDLPTCDLSMIFYCNSIANVRRSNANREGKQRNNAKCNLPLNPNKMFVPLSIVSLTIFCSAFHGYQRLTSCCSIYLSY